MKKTIFLFLKPIIILIVSSCGYREPAYCALASKITNKYSRELAEEKGLLVYCFGGAMMDDLQYITMGYIVPQKMSLEEARRLYIEVTGEYIRRLNAEEKLHPYIRDFPASIDNVHIFLSFRESPVDYFEDPDCVAVLSNLKSNRHRLCYWKSEQQKLRDLHEETYEEALEIVKQEQANASSDRAV